MLWLAARCLRKPQHSVGTESTSADSNRDRSTGAVPVVLCSPAWGASGVVEGAYGRGSPAVRCALLALWEGEGLLLDEGFTVLDGDIGVYIQSNLADIAGIDFAVHIDLIGFAAEDAVEHCGIDGWRLGPDIQEGAERELVLC